MFSRRQSTRQRERPRSASSRIDLIPWKTTKTIVIVLVCAVAIHNVVDSILFPDYEQQQRLGHQNQQPTKPRVPASSKIPITNLTLLVVDNDNDSWKSNLYRRLNHIRRVCGDLCAIEDNTTYQSQKISMPSSSFGHRFEFPDLNCDALMEHGDDIDAADSVQPRRMPKELIPLFSLHETIQYKHVYVLRNKQYLGKTAEEGVWTKEMIAEQMESIGHRTLQGSYGPNVTMSIYDQMKRSLNLSNKSVLVVGSERPWLEVICLSLGASRVTTLEYGRIKSLHPQIQTVVPSEFRQAYFNTKNKSQNDFLFDVIVSFSSLEHPGLGRYGDALNPWGDLLAVARTWCVTKPGGQLFLGLPSGIDDVQYNKHRTFGFVRWPLVTANWIQVDYNGSDERQKILKEGNGAATSLFPNSGLGFVFRKVDFGENE